MTKTRLLPMLLSALLVTMTTACPGDPECGNGEVEESEQCDDGNKVAGDGCENNCTKTAPLTCGNAVVDSGEECDDGNQVAGDGCENNCTVSQAVCGNGVKEGSEECDDGNRTDSDACGNDCKRNVSDTCGNGTVETFEECDDSNKVPGDGCENNCTVTPDLCGNGVKEGVEECDDGNLDDYDACGNDCVKNSCGNGVKDSGEACDDGNESNADDCSTECTTITPVQGDSCTVTSGNGTLLIKGDILLPDRVLQGQLVVGTDGLIKCVDVDCSAQAAGATVLDCKNTVVSPGLINAHDHITYCNNAPYVAPANKADERFDHRHDWREGLRGHTKISTPGRASNVAMSGQELRFVMGGATSTVSSGFGPGLLRNLDKELLNLDQKEAQYETFPLGDSDGTMHADGCGYSFKAASTADAYFPHVAEGIDHQAHNEFLCLETTAGGGRDIVQPNAAFIHGVGAMPPDVAWMELDGTKLIWSPRTNVSLYGNTAPVTLYSRAGATIALGTDWTRSGSTSMLRELKCVADLNETYFDSFFTDREIWKMATINGAKAAAMDDGAGIGILSVGKVADIALFRKAAGRINYRAVIDAEPADVVLVLRGGQALYGDAAVVNAVPAVNGCEAITVCGAAKTACVGETGAKLAAIKAEAENYSPLFACNGAPPMEPTCQPSRKRTEDSANGSTVYDGMVTELDDDGDNIPDTEDNCPKVFNPIRPMDNGKQGDFDLDGYGDVCDVCPISADNANCPTFTPGDYDLDGVPDATDNCFAVPNPGQENPDGDARGSACDKCPADKDPCPPAAVTVYQIKTGAIADGESATIKDVVVTGKDAKGYFVQVLPSTSTHTGVENSGLYIFTNATAPTVSRGDQLEITGTVTTFKGQKELTAPVATVKNSDLALPEPTTVTPAEIMTGGAKAKVLEGTLVKVVNVKVTNANPDDPDNYGEFAVGPKDGSAGSVRVAHMMYTMPVAAAEGDEFSSITGVLNWRFDNTKIEPRDASDIVEGAVIPRVKEIVPATGFLRAGTTGVATFPEPMKVRLVRALATDTEVTVTSSDANVVVVGGKVTVPAGVTEAAFSFNGVSQLESATITATIGDTSATGTVRVLGIEEAPTKVVLTPATATVAPGATATFTVTLDIPAPAAGAVVDVDVTPNDAATVPATVTFAKDEMVATFDFVAGATEQTGISLVASLGAIAASEVEVAISSGPQPSGTLVINEIMTRGDDGVAGNEFIELYNGTSGAIDLSGYVLCYRGGAATSGQKMAITFGANSTVPAGKFFLAATSIYNGTVPADATLTSNGMNDQGGSVWLAHKTSCPTGLTDPDLDDVVGWGSAPATNYEGAAAPSLGANADAAKGKSLARKVAGVDSNNNAADFAVGTAAPQNLSSL